MNKHVTDRDLLASYHLSDRYTLESGRVFLTGTQALVRVVLDQARRDRAAGLHTGGLVSGYRGSPLGAVDLEMWRARELTEKSGIEFLPAINEDLAATAILGSQQVETNPDRTVKGVFGLWYGKGPGIDRAGDALKHGNAYGSSPHGGVLVVAGDDHGCVSSSMPHQSDVAFMTFLMPTLNPASIAEYLAFGEYGYALSRFSGMWVGFKAISETVEAGASVPLTLPRQFAEPDYMAPPGGLHYRWPDLPGPQIEERMEAKKHAVFAFAEANPIDRRIYDVKDARFGIVTTGKGHLDLMEALRLLGLGEAECRKLGIDIYKVGMVWPLARRDALDFVRGKGRGPRHRGKARHHRKPAQRVFLRLARPQAARDGRQARRGGRKAGAVDRRTVAQPVVAHRRQAARPVCSRDEAAGTAPPPCWPRTTG
jgi:indolepyruvate ferredoxin oxidoreductase